MKLYFEAKQFISFAHTLPYTTVLANDAERINIVETGSDEDDVITGAIIEKIRFLDENPRPRPEVTVESMKGCMRKYVNPDLLEKYKDADGAWVNSAWSDSAVEKHDNFCRQYGIS